MAGRLVKKCPCLRPKMEEEIRVLDYRHSSLQDVPSEVFNVERTLEELYTDSNQIRDLPRELFYCHGLRKLSISDNEITSIPPAISSLTNLEELDFSKNGVIEVPDSIKGCKYLRVIDASVNPLGKLPEGFTQLANLTHLFLNDTFIDYLPGSFGRMTSLKILEIRENHLKTLPRSFGRLATLERLDIGNNEFTELSDVVGSLGNLLELWCDNNQITKIHPAIGNLKQLIFLDASKNHLQELPAELEGCTSLADIHLTSNRLLSLPESLGNLNNLTTLKVDDNQLTYLPKTLGGLTSLSELNVSENDLEDLPASIGLLRNLRTFYADENLLRFIPAELGSCSGITILSLRSNKLTYIPDELGRIPRLRVLNLSDNLLRYLPFTIVKLKELQALWLTENQTRPLIPLQSEYEEETGRKILTCYLLPQGELQPNDERDPSGDTSSFHASIWDEERLRRQQIQFDFNDNSDEEGTLVRCPTPYPKEMRGKVRHARNLAMRRAISDCHDKNDADEIDVGSRNPRGSESQDESQQAGFGYSRVSDYSEVRLRENRTPKPTSPRPESHKLYRYDKEKQQKDKARMQHRLSAPDMDSEDVKVLLRDNSSKRGKQGDTARLSGSSPDLSVLPGDNELSPTASVGVSTSNDAPEDLYQRQLLSQHRGRRSRRTRDYDSDTGCRSDVDGRLLSDYGTSGRADAFSENLSVRSQPLPHRHHRHRHKGRHSGGYGSDVENRYNMHETANAAVAAYQQRQQQQNTRNSYDHRISAGSSSQISTPTTTHNFRPSSPSRSEPRTFSRGVSNDAISQSGRSSRTTYNPGFVSNDNYQQFMLKGKGDYHSVSSHPLPPASNSNQLSNSDLNQSIYSLKINSDKSVSLLSVCSKEAQPSSQSQQGHLPPPVAPKPNLHKLKGGSNLSIHSSVNSSQPAPMFHNESFLGQSTPIASNAPTTVMTRSASQGYDCERRTEVDVYSIPDGKRAPRPQSSHSLSSNHSRVTPPPYPSVPPYRRPSESPRPNSHTGRASSESSSSNRNSPLVGISTSNLSSKGPPSSASILHHHNINKSQSSPCGFHGASPYTDLHPASSREQLSHGNYLDIDHTRQNVNPHIAPDSRTTRSGSSSSQIGSASQTGHPYHSHSNMGRNSDRHLSDSSDSRSDGHNRSSPHDFPRGGHGYPMHKSASHQDHPFDPYSSSFEVNPLDDMRMIPNQEQSSQVSSSTDSGYGHGHHVYERIKDFANTSKGPGSHSSGPTSTPPSQRQTPTKRMLDNNPPSREMTPVKDPNLNPDSTTEDHRDEFRVTIKKNPGLGFSIAGGIGSMGNPFRVNDKGIFVTKIVPNGPASANLRPGDKILEVNNLDFRDIHHSQAVSILKNNNSVSLLVERIQKVNMV